MKKDRLWRTVEYLGGNFLQFRALLLQSILGYELVHILSLSFLLVVHQPTEHSEFFTSHTISLYTRKVLRKENQ